MFTSLDGRGWGRVFSVLQAALPDDLKHAFEVLKNVIAPKSEHLVSLILEKLIPLFVLLRAFRMLAAV